MSLLLVNTRVVKVGIRSQATRCKNHGKRRDESSQRLLNIRIPDVRLESCVGQGEAPSEEGIHKAWIPSQACLLLVHGHLSSGL